MFRKGLEGLGRNLSTPWCNEVPYTILPLAVHARLQKRALL
jgi:hypothetical protein